MKNVVGFGIIGPNPGTVLFVFRRNKYLSKIWPAEVSAGVRTHAPPAPPPQRRRAAVLVGISWCFSVGGGNNLAHLHVMTGRQCTIAE